MKLKLLLKAILQQLFIVAKWILITSIIFSIVGFSIYLDNNPQGMEIFSMIGAGIVLILFLTLMILLAWMFFDDIRYKYIKLLKDNDCQDRKYKVKYKIVLEGEQIVSAKHPKDVKIDLDKLELGGSYDTNEKELVDFKIKNTTLIW